MPLSLSFFISFQARLDGRSLTNFRAVKVQGLLVYLALEAEKAHARDVLATLFWPEAAESVAKQNLRQSLYQLRRLLKDTEANETTYLTVTRQTVQFNQASAYELDVHSFLTAIAQGNLAPAVALYQGDLLPGFTCDSLAFEEWLRLEREHLHRLALETMSALAEQQLAQGDLEGAQETAYQQLALEPWHEMAHRQMMLALALSGNRSAALAQFDLCYAALEAELGIEPADQTLALYEQIATGVIAPAPAAKGLPRPGTPFIGRVAEISHIIRTLNKPDCRLLTLTGPGGVGKTRLAIEVAHKYVAQTGNEAYFVSLLGVEDTAQAHRDLAKAAGLPVLTPTQTAHMLAKKYAGAPALFILDNAEPLVRAAGDEFVAWLNTLSEAGDAIRILVTSRQPLQAQNEWVLPIRGLAIPDRVAALNQEQWPEADALALFKQRAQQADVTFALTAQNIEAVGQLCRRLEGSPLAIELAAAQTRDYSVAEIVAALGDRPADLHANLRDLPPRHRSLAAVYRQSWDLLDNQEQAVLRDVAVFQGGFSRAAARFVLADRAGLLESLVEKALLSRQYTPEGVTHVRYRMAPAVQGFVAAIEPFSAVIGDSHAEYYLAWAVKHQEQIASERDNIRAAWQWAQEREDGLIPRRWNPEWLEDGGSEAVAGSVASPTTASPPARPVSDVLVGREAEMARLRAALQPLRREQRNGGLFTVLGGPGIGKSYLLAQLRAENAGFIWVDCPCDEDSSQSLLPFRRWLHHYFGQKAGGSSPANRAAFDSYFDDLVQATPDGRLAAELRRLRSLLAALVDLVLPDSRYTRLRPEQRLENFQQAIVALIRAESLLQPLIIHLEDAHWLDTDSRRLVEMLLRDTDSYPFVMFVTARPAGFEPFFLLDAAQETVRLEPLTAGAVAQLAGYHLDHPPATDLVNLLHSRCAGNPFYTTQLLLHLRENGLVADGKLVPTAGFNRLDTLLPVDLHNLLVARIGKLEPAAREIAGRAAVLGPEFSLPVLSHMVDAGTLRRGLDDGLAAGIWMATANEQYMFNHVLLHDAVYTTQFREQRQEYHRQAAQAVMAVSTPNKPHFAAIAYHFEQAGRPRQAVPNYLKAGDEARSNYFIREAHNYYSHGLTLADTDKQRLPLLLGREAVNHWLGNREQQQEDLRRLVQLTAGSGDRPLQADVGLRQATFALVTGDYAQAVQHAQRTSALAVATGDRALEARALHRWGRALWQQGNAQGAQPLLKRSLRLAELAGDALQQGRCRYDLAIIHFYAHNYASAQEQVKAAIPLYAAGNDKQGLIRCYNLLGIIAKADSHYEAALAYYEQSIQLAKTISWRYGEARILTHQGNIWFELGEFAQCRRHHERALAISQGLGDREAEALSYDSIGLAYLHENEPDMAQQAFEQALAIDEAINNPRDKAYVLTHLGALLTDREQIEKAGMLLYEAVALRMGSQSGGIVVDTQAALAWLDMARGDADLAAERALEIAALLDEQGITGIEQPAMVYWQVFAILQATGHQAEADAVLEAAATLIQSRAERIQDKSLRHNYLMNVSYHRRILFAWESRLSNRSLLT